MATTRNPSPTYDGNPIWSSITPIPLKTPANPSHDLAAIAYSSHYLEATSYLRAVMAANEISERALDLTKDIVGMNPAHYTVWLYRAKIVIGLGEREEESEKGASERRLRTELAWLNGVAKKNLKNYQIWHHRQLIMTRLNDPTGEREVITSILALDAKNYHVWTYRQWLVRHFSLWDDPAELDSTTALIDSDIRNNSAWNHRFYLLFGKATLDEREASSAGWVIDEDLVDREVAFAKDSICKAPQNQSPWNYLIGTLRQAGRDMREEQAFAEQFADLTTGGGAKKVVSSSSSFALEFLADCATEEGGDVEEGRRALEALRDEFDPIRKGFWEWRIRELLEGGKEELGRGGGAGPGGKVLRHKGPGERGHGPVVRV